MSDPGTQLRSYLDQTVERVDMDDVFARARAGLVFDLSLAQSDSIFRRSVWIKAQADNKACLE